MSSRLDSFFPLSTASCSAGNDGGFSSPVLLLHEWIRRTNPGDVTRAVLAAWADEAQKLVLQPEKAANREEGAKKAWIKRRLPGRPAKASPIDLNVEQRELIAQAIERVREIEEDPAITEGRAIEFISADFLAGN